MKLLFLLRHAEAASGAASTADHDRPLTPHGSATATEMGRYIAEKDQKPEIILSSTALRAATTAQLVARQYGSEAAIHYERGLYSCGVDALLQRICAVGAGLTSLMIVAHNPDLHELSTLLAAAGEGAGISKLRSTFPPCALAILALGIQAWPAVRPGCATLDRFVVPDELGHR